MATAKTTTTVTRTVPSLAAVKAAIGTDFLQRDGDSFVYQRGGRVVDWEKSLPSGSAYSEEILSLDRKYGPVAEELVIVKAHGMASRLLDALDIKGNIAIRLNHDSDESYTDSRVVQVSSKVFDDRSLDIAHRLDIFLGTAEHEGLHCEFTDFSAGRGTDEILHSILNIVEDERIEHKAGEKYPGLVNYLKEFKYYYFLKYRENHREEFDKGDYPCRLLNAIIALVRFPKALTDKEMEDFGEYLVPIHDVLKEFPDTTADALECSKKILEIIKDALKTAPTGKKSSKSGSGSKSEGRENEGPSRGDGGKDEQEKEEKKPGSSSKKDKEGKENEDPGQGDKDGTKGENSEDTEQSSPSKGKDEEDEGDSQDSEDGEDTGDEGNERDSQDSEDGEDTGDEGNERDSQDSEDGKGAEPISEKGGNGASDKCSDEKDGESEEQESDGGEEEGEEEREYRELTPSEVEKAFEKLRKLLREFCKENDSSSQEAGAVKRNADIDAICSGSREHGTDNKIMFFTVKADPRAEEVYRKDLDAVRCYIPAMRNIIAAQGTTFSYQLRGMRSGKLDGSRLSQAFIGNPNVYRQTKEVKSDRVAVCVLVDESGSMSGSKITSARRTAVLLNEALGKQSNVDFYLYGHTADEDRYPEYAEQKTDASISIRAYRDRMTSDRYALGRMKSRCDNADGYAILETARRVREQTKEKVLYFIISDGSPAYDGYSSTYEGVQHTRKAVKEVEKMGFVPVQIAIDSDCEPSSMFSHYVELTDMSALPKALGSIIRKAVLDNTARH